MKRVTFIETLCSMMLPAPLSFYYPRLSTWVGRLVPSVCLSVCLSVSVRIITQKRMIPKYSNLIQGMNLGYTRSGILLGLKGQRSKSQGQ